MTIGRLLELGRIGDAGPPLAVNLADLQTGAPVVVDSASAELGAGLPPTEIDGKWFCDGGFSANLPLHAVLDPPPETDVVCMAVDLLGEPGPPIFSVDGMMERSNDLLFANQTRAAIATLKARYAARVDGGSVLVLLLACNGEGERLSQIWDYSRRSLHERWRAGYDAGIDLVGQIRDTEPPPPGRFEVRSVVPSAVPS